MDLIYASEKVREQCTSRTTAKKLFGGDTKLADKLLAHINSLKQAPTLKDIVVQPHFHFHKLSNKYGKDLEGYFAIDVKSRTSPWRLILRPLNKDGNPFEPCNIDEIASKVEVIGIKEVSKHYE